MGGFPKEMFISTPPESYMCSFCNLIVRHPVQASCGHRYCGLCAEDALKSGKLKCQPCRESGEHDFIRTKDEIFPDRGAERDLHKYEVRCQSHCDWCGKLQDFEGHFSEGAEMQRLPQGSYTQGPRQTSSDNVGVKLVKEIKNTDSKVDDMHAHLSEVEESLRRLEVGIRALIPRQKALSSRVQQMQSEGREQEQMIQRLEEQIKAQDRIIALKDVALAEQDLRIQALEQTSYDGILVWKISDFSRKRQDALSGGTTSVYSPCFFTSRHGYKMCARIYLNGDGMGKGNHISLFFVVMQGPSDALLRWPFKQKVTLTLLDQNNHEHTGITNAFSPDPTSSSFKRPTSGMNIASGCPLFMPISQVDSPHHAYVKDDVMFIKIIVDTSDLEQD
ncbi:TNF receptor-associated factor 2-like [Ptychodera flava]|uniref:TNF receptor-associated factor 2-like n=1 Tax=Ptychodera flava TaxID=63121 RepID=UPI00396A1636